MVEGSAGYSELLETENRPWAIRVPTYTKSLQSISHYFRIAECRTREIDDTIQVSKHMLNKLHELLIKMLRLKSCSTKRGFLEIR